MHDIVQDQDATLEDITLDKIFKEELTRAIAEALEELPKKDQAFIEYRFFKDMTYQEIDPEHSNQATRQRIEKALRKLRRNRKLLEFYEEENLLIHSSLKAYRNNRPTTK